MRYEECEKTIYLATGLGFRVTGSAAVNNGTGGSKNDVHRPNHNFVWNKR